MSGPRRPSYTEQLERTVAELTRENEIKARLAEVAEREIAALRAALQPSPPAPVFVPLKRAEARGYSVETVRRWCHRKLVKHRWDGQRLLVDQNDLTERCNRLTGHDI
jgi:hypothetical protein